MSRDHGSFVKTQISVSAQDPQLSSSLCLHFVSLSASLFPVPGSHPGYLTTFSSAIFLRLLFILGSLELINVVFTLGVFLVGRTRNDFYFLNSQVSVC